ncbi:hypothetical protein Q0N58_14710, partial [Staphylococcus aureus]|nr:hypothetical protein [Staphylococcus aureus]
KLKPSNTGLSSASRHSGRELEVRPQTTGGSRSSPGKNTATTAASNKSTTSPGDKDKVKQRPRSSLGVTGAGATVTRTPVRSSASATSSKQP